MMMIWTLVLLKIIVSVRKVRNKIYKNNKLVLLKLYLKKIMIILVDLYNLRIFPVARKQID